MCSTPVQVSKPLANRAKSFAQNSDAFKSVMVGFGRNLNRLTIQLERRAEGKDALAHISPLNELAAVERGAEFFSEAIIYSVAGRTPPPRLLAR